MFIIMPAYNIIMITYNIIRRHDDVPYNVCDARHTRVYLERLLIRRPMIVRGPADICSGIRPSSSVVIIISVVARAKGVYFVLPRTPFTTLLLLLLKLIIIKYVCCWIIVIFRLSVLSISHSVVLSWVCIWFYAVIVIISNIRSVFA